MGNNGCFREYDYSSSLSPSKKLELTVHSLPHKHYLFIHLLLQFFFPTRDVITLHIIIIFPSPVNETAVQRRHGMVSPPRLAPEEEVEEVGLSATSSSSSLSHSQITVSNDKAIAVVKFHNEESIRSEPPVSLQEAGSLAMTGEKPVVLRHKKVSALKEEFGVTSALALKRTSSGPSTRKVSADVVMMQRTSSGSFIRRPPSRSSTGSAPKKSRFSVTSLLSRKSMDIESETANLILAGEDQEDGPDILQGEWSNVYTGSSSHCCWLTVHAVVG